MSHLGVPFDPLDLAGALREHLRAIGLDNERPELFTSTDRRIMIRVHDLRGTFVTIALANGRSESWISDRTGHRSSQMIAKYKRPARTFDELQLGDLVPLDHGETNDLEAGCNPQTSRLEEDLSAARVLFPRRPALLSPSECRILARTFGVEVRQQLKCSLSSQTECLNRTPLTVFRRNGGAQNWYPIVSIDRLWSVRDIGPVYRVRGDKVTCWRCADGRF